MLSSAIAFCHLGLLRQRWQRRAIHAVQALEKAGASVNDIDTWIKHVPASLLGIDNP